MLPDYNASSQSGFRIFLSKLSQKGIYMHHSDIFHADRHLKKIDNRLTFDVRYSNSQDM